MGEPLNDDRLDDAVRAQYRRPPQDEEAAARRALDRVRELPPPARGGGLTDSRSLTLSPLAATFAALMLVALGAVMGLWAARGRPAGRPDPAVAPVATAGPDRMIRFALVAPQASSVAVVGDFNGWNAQSSPMRRSGDTWTLAVPVPRGHHVYAFVVDGSRWERDPAAPLAPEDEFGFRKSVIVVGESGS